MHFDLWHGTNQTFDRFDAKKLGLNTSNPASKAAFFFAVDPETARDYAGQASRNLIPDQEAHEAQVAQLLRDADDAMRRGDHNRYEALVLQAEEMECAALQAEPQGARILHCRVSFENPLEIDGSSHAVVVDLGGVLAQARADGYDAVILTDILDTPSGAGEPDPHVAVFDAMQVEILEVIELGVEEPVDAPEFA